MSTPQPNNKDLNKAFSLLCIARRMAELYDENRPICKYVHSTSRGHELIQLVSGFLLESYDYASLYYRDESILLGMGFRPYELMLQLLAKADDPFSGGRSYYGHPSSLRDDIAKIPHQSSATGMQVIPATGMAQGISYLESQDLNDPENSPVVLCSLGDGSVTEGEVAEAFQMAGLHKLPIIYLVQDNEWGISATSAEMRAMDARYYAKGFKGIKRAKTIDGTDFLDCWSGMIKAFNYVREQRAPILVHVKVPLLGHHTSGVRKEWYRPEEDLAEHESRDPLDKMIRLLKKNGFSSEELESINEESISYANKEFEEAVKAPEPDPKQVHKHIYAETDVQSEKGNRNPLDGEKVVMVDAALHACDEILRQHPEALFYGQDVGGSLGGVFREAANLAKKYGDKRVFNTPIQEAYIVGSTAGMSAVGTKPIVEIQFADYIWTGINQLVVELSKSSYLTMGKFPVQSLIRIPCGAYGGGGPYHSGCIESAILSIHGVKVVYPSNAADIKGLMKAAFYDPNPVVMFEHKGLYWSKVPGTENAKTIEPDVDYIIPLGKARIWKEASQESIEEGSSALVVTYGMGVYWAEAAALHFNDQIEILDLRCLNPVDNEMILERVKVHGKCLVLTEEQLKNSFAEALSGRIARKCFEFLDAPVAALGAMDLPAVPMNIGLEKEMLPNPEKVKQKLEVLLNY